MNTNFEPFVRYIAKTTYIISGKFIIANDCRIIYIITGSGSLETQDKIYSLSPGTLIYYPCGMPYKFTLSKENDLMFYTVNFDFSHKYANINPMRPEEYKGCPPSNILYTQNESQCKIFENIIYLPSSIWCENELQKIYNEDLFKTEGYEAIQSAVMKMILLKIFRNAQTFGHNSLCDKIEETISKNIKYNNKQIAEVLNYHPFYLNNIYKKEKGITLHQYILKQRLIKAHYLITSTKMTMEEISSLCGFSSQAHLTSSFKKSYGITPTEIRKLL